MKAPSSLLCGLPPECFGEHPLQEFHQETVRRLIPRIEVAERRLHKGSAPEEQTARLLRLGRLVEDTVLDRMDAASTKSRFQLIHAQGGFPAVRIGSDYSEMLQLDRLASPGRTWVSSPVIPPGAVRDHLEWLRTTAHGLGFEYTAGVRQRISFISGLVIPAGFGLIDLPDAFSLSPSRESELIPAPRKHFIDRIKAWFGFAPRAMNHYEDFDGPERASLEPLPNDPTDWMDYQPGGSGDFSETRLRSQIQGAIDHQSPVALGNQRHGLLISTLQPFVCGGPATRVDIPMSFEEGAPTLPFPLKCVPPLPDGWAPTRELRVGLMSMRHLGIDGHIDFNWFRNEALQLKRPGRPRRSLTEIDRYCFETSMALFNELLEANTGHRLRVHLYHTGFLPPILGFYRALTTTLASGQHAPGALQVIPRPEPSRSRPNHFAEGSPWPN